MEFGIKYSYLTPPAPVLTLRFFKAVHTSVCVHLCTYLCLCLSACACACACACGRRGRGKQHGMILTSRANDSLDFVQTVGRRKHAIHDSFLQRELCSFS